MSEMSIITKPSGRDQPEHTDNLIGLVDGIPSFPKTLEEFSTTDRVATVSNYLCFVSPSMLI